jgi:hypothetical protein
MLIYMSRKRLIVLLLVAANAFFSCRKENTSWETDWRLPIINDTLAINDLVNDSTLAVNADNSLQVRLQRRLATLDFFDLVEIPDTFIVQDFTINFSQLELPPGTVYVDEVDEHDFDLGDVVLTQARFAEGAAKIRIENPVETTVLFDIELPGVTLNGQTFQQSVAVPPAQNGQAGVRDFELPLAGHNVDLRGINGNQFNKLRSRMTARTSPDGPTVTITNQDIVIFRVQMDGLRLDYAKGYFGSQVIHDTAKVDAEILRNITDGSIAFEPLSAALTVSNGIKAKAQVRLNELNSINFNANTVALQHPIIGQKNNIDAAQGDASNLFPSQWSVLFDAANSNLNAFVENIGYNYEVDYSIFLNPWGNTSLGNDEIFPNSRVNVDLETDFLLGVGMQNLTLRDTFDFDFSQENNIAKVKEGTLVVEVENGFPFEGALSLRMLDDNSEEIGIIAGSQSLLAGTTDATAGLHGKQNSELRFELTPELVSQLEAIRSIEVNVQFNSITFPENILYANAELFIKAYCLFKLKTEL